MGIARAHTFTEEALGDLQTILLALSNFTSKPTQSTATSPRSSRVLLAPGGPSAPQNPKLKASPMPFKRLTNGSPSVAFTVYESIGASLTNPIPVPAPAQPRSMGFIVNENLVLPPQNARQVDATKKAHANLFPFVVLEDSTPPVFPKDALSTKGTP